jgi:hypothetical protein
MPRQTLSAARRTVSPSDPVLRVTEQSFERQVIAYAEIMGWRIFKDRATNMPRACKACKAPIRTARNVAGLPDLILVRRPRVVWAELKSERGTLSDEQRDWLAALRDCEQETYVWKPSDWELIERVLR